MRVAAVQHDICWEDRDATLARIEPLVGVAAASGARLVVLPEMFAVGFTMHTERVAEPAEGPTVAWLRGQAAAHGVWIGGSFPAGSPGRPANQFALAAPSGEVLRYDKIHPFSYSGEDEHYRAGTATWTADVEGVRVTPFVCYDLRFADGFWDAAAETDLFVVPANWPAARRHHWRTLLVARAIENQAYVLGVNRVGGDYVGDSCIVDPWGEVLASGAGGETVLVADVDPAVVAKTRADYPFMHDR